MNAYLRYFGKFKNLPPIPIDELIADLKNAGGDVG
jgi:hypothetical protein